MENLVSSGSAPILLTGGTGFVGSHLIKAVKKEFPDVPLYLCTRPGSETKAQALGARPLLYDGTPSSLLNWEIESKALHVLHLATCFRSQHKFAELEEILGANLNLGTYLLDWLKNFETSVFLNVGSFAQFNEGKYVAQNLYIATKNAFEAVVNYYSHVNGKSKTVTVYLSDTYGPQDPRPKVLNLLINASREERELKLSPGLQELSLLHVNDACAGIIAAYRARLASESAEHLRYSLFATEIKSLLEIAGLVERATGSAGFYKFGSLPYRDKEIMKFVPAFPPPPGWHAKRPLSEGIASLL
jgi:nucleoside-diphosphate-sugar epimerase